MSQLLRYNTTKNTKLSGIFCWVISLVNVKCRMSNGMDVCKCDGIFHRFLFEWMALHSINNVGASLRMKMPYPFQLFKFVGKQFLQFFSLYSGQSASFIYWFVKIKALPCSRFISYLRKKLFSFVFHVIFYSRWSFLANLAKGRLAQRFYRKWKIK